MDWRTNQVLIDLVDGGNPTVAALADDFSLSDRMVRRMIGVLNEELRGQFLPEVEVGTSGRLSFAYDYDGLSEDVVEYLHKCTYYTYRLSPTERKAILTVILLRETGFVTAQELSEHLETSRNTILTDLSQLKTWFEINGLELSSRVQKGYQVLGEEQTIRTVLSDIMRHNLDYRGLSRGAFRQVFQRLLLEEIGYSERFADIAAIIRSAEAQHDIYLSDFSFLDLSVEILVICERLLRLSKIEEYRVRQSLTRSSKYPMSCFIFDRLSELLYVEIPNSERRLFVETLRRQSFLKAETTTANMEEEVIHVIVAEAVNSISSQLHLTPYLEFSLYDILVDHFKSAIYRSLNHSVITYPFLDEVVGKYPQVFNTIKQNVQPLEHYLKAPLSDDEVGFIATYFAAIYEQQKAERRSEQKVRAELRIGQGRGSAELFKSQLIPLEDVLDIVAVESLYKHDEEVQTAHNADLIIADAPCETQGCPCVVTKSVVLTQEDLNAIRQQALEILDSKLRSTGESQAASSDSGVRGAILAPDAIDLDVDISTWQEAVLHGGKLLQNIGAVREGYAEAMVDTIGRHGPYVVILKGLAIPHASVDSGALKNAVSLVRLKDPVAFGSASYDPVRWVACMSLLSSKTANATIFNLTRIFSDAELVAELDSATSTQDVFDLLHTKL